MPKKAKRTKKKLGRPVEISDRDLLERFQALKRVLEDNWGRVGLRLQKARRLDDVKKALRLVPGVEQFIPFRDQKARCLVQDLETKVTLRELRSNQEKYKSAVANQNRLWSEYHNARRKAEEAAVALKAFITQFEGAIFLLPFFAIAAQLAKELKVEELTNRSNRLGASLRLIEDEKKRLEQLLQPQEAWYARTEVVRFARNRRYEKTVTNFAKAMAGLPEYAWLHSLRKCSRLRDKSQTATSYLLFEIVRSAVNKTKPANLRKIEARLRDDLLREDADFFVRAYVAPNWAYMRQAFADCRSKGFRRRELPYHIMAQFLYHMERPKTLPEIELAKLEQLVIT